MRQVLLDMDGVVVDFIGGAFAWHGRTVPDEVPWKIWECMGLTEEEFWEPLGFEFWSSLKPTSDGMELVAELERLAGTENIAVLSSPCLTRGCADGKLAWLESHLPQFSRRYLLGPAKQFAAGPGKVLVDDYWHNIEGFRKAGGEAVLVPRKWNSLQHLCSPCGRTDMGFVLSGVKQHMEE